MPQILPGHGPVPLGPDALDAVTGGVTINGTYGSDRLAGTAGADNISGYNGTDAIAGGGGADTINGGAGPDVLQGDGGNDRLDGGAGDHAADTAFGGDGDDQFRWAPGGGYDSFRGGAGQDTLVVSDVSMSQLREGLQVQGEGLRMQVSGNNVTFTDALGRPATFAGTLTIGSETLTFSEVERIQVG